MFWCHASPAEMARSGSEDSPQCSTAEVHLQPGKHTDHTWGCSDQLMVEGNANCVFRAFTDQTDPLLLLEGDFFS